MASQDEIKRDGDWLDVDEVLSPLFHLLSFCASIVVFVQNRYRDVRSRTNHLFGHIRIQPMRDGSATNGMR
jgi:hypothetical protein